MTEVSCSIVNRVNSAGRPFSEVLYTILEDDHRVTKALTRYWWPLPDTPMQRAREAQTYLERRKRYADG